MELTNFSMPGYRVNEYLIVIRPPEDIRNKVDTIRSEFAERYKIEYKSKGRSHITLVSFHALEMMEEKILQRVQTISMGIAPFKVELKDYGSFPSHSIFVNVISKLPVQSLIRELKAAQLLFKLNNEHRPHFLDEPHIPLCRMLKPWQYEQGWIEFSHRQFTGRFIADSMLLLKRVAGQKSPFQIAGRFEFRNLPVSTKQGNLFG